MRNKDTIFFGSQYDFFRVCTVAYRFATNRLTVLIKRHFILKDLTFLTLIYPIARNVPYHEIRPSLSCLNSANHVTINAVFGLFLQFSK